MSLGKKSTGSMPESSRLLRECLVFFVVTISACGSSSTGSGGAGGHLGTGGAGGAAGMGDAGGADGGDGGIDRDGPAGIACGTHTCTASQLCVTPCCRGAGCTPAPAFCVDIPAA